MAVQQLGSGRISNGQDPSRMKVSVTILSKEQWTAEVLFESKENMEWVVKDSANIVKTM